MPQHPDAARALYAGRYNFFVQQEVGGLVGTTCVFEFRTCGTIWIFIY